ncbi:hypothetical protein [Saccharopolyspora rhizosphaerae]|uniref:hypothetical protein n=1 Tax=Saccharopolyspora rhizosphaerae TaxID=2492662 RepID=UPI001F3F08A5|nr:hypothetical protein [Saccharopolyspora rhizosphaerae]
MLEEYLRGWRPRPVVEHDAMAPEQSRALANVLETAAPVDELPPLWHWVHFLSWPPHSDLGPDGHPLDGDFLPPVPDRRRMFAGGRLTIQEPLRLGTPAERTTELGDVQVKQGRTGEMAFVTERREFHQDGRLRISEEVDYVYRSGENEAKNPNRLRPTDFPKSQADWQWGFTADPVRLFRFSALTANSHRIHYDETYCREVEAYPGLVVHGPLLVLLMTELARENGQITDVSYRLRRPVFSGDPVLVCGGPDGAMSVRSDQVHAEASMRFAEHR